MGHEFVLYRVFIDPRYGPYWKQVNPDYFNFTRNPNTRALRQLSSKYPFKSALIRLRDVSLIYSFMESGEWKPLFSDHIAVLPGAEKVITEKIRELLTQLPPPGLILEVGCGPSSRLWRLGLNPIGLDLSPEYSATFAKKGEAINGSAMALPFQNASFNSVWSMGMFHHLPDAPAREVVSEMIRVLRPGGFIVIFDAVLPEPAWRQPIANIPWKLDRGRFIRTQKALGAILSQERLFFTCERMKYSFIGLEGALCWFHSPTA